jgi:hypothetical protein
MYCHKGSVYSYLRHQKFSVQDQILIGQVTGRISGKGWVEEDEDELHISTKDDSPNSRMIFFIHMWLLTLTFISPLPPST